MYVSEVSRLLSYWANGGLDDLVDQGHIVNGVEGCTAYGKGFRAQSLVSRFTSEEVELALMSMAECPEARAYAIALVFSYLKGWTHDRLARVMGGTVPTMGDFLLSAEERFLKSLLKTE